MELILKIKELPPLEQPTMASLDIISMYTNINLEQLTNYIEDDLADLMAFHDYNRSEIEGIWDLLLFSLKNNFFQFESKFFKQTAGLAMGSPLTPLLANYFVGKLEATFLQKTPCFVYTYVTWTTFCLL